MNEIGAESASMLPGTRVNASALRAKPSADQARICKAAQEFEAELLTILFQKMEASASTLGGDDRDSAESSYREFGVQELASAVAASGGIGISRMIVPYLTRAAEPGNGSAKQPSSDASEASKSGLKKV
jgi:Rod binding domain-containing protein